ncbi:chloroplast envelope membrane protein isoform X3 [Syzygium oleosum]|uniref:chloroplast envelope membrane protein isoform X3 n=1 Tax=Syzygium oleosum TaxID=219896 RepID=UPI0024BB0826|nr:chloroplast envelope membrane protein isoform X3 [Syzygium oleosum]
MIASVVATRGLVFFDANARLRPTRRSVKKFSASPRVAARAARFDVLVPNSKGKRKGGGGGGRRTSWWKRFFLEDDGNWLGLKEDDMLEDEVEEHSGGGEGSPPPPGGGDKFEAWKRRAEAIVELREAQQDSRNEESRMWEDWLVDDGAAASWDDGNGGAGNSGEELVLDSGERGIVKSVSDMILGREDDDMLYEDRVFRYASQNSAKFLAILIIIPCALDFMVHDYVLMPFLDSLELRDEWRLENRRAFANIWSDMVFGISLFLILYFNQSKVSLLKFTGYKIINNISDTGKAFLIILITDICLGYHSESGWQTLLEVIVEHYGVEVDQSAITFFVCLIPVIIDACVKLWLFKFLPRLSPKVSNIFQEMKRH